MEKVDKISPKKQGDLIDHRPDQPNDQPNAFDLLSLPREILEHILFNLEDKDILTVSHVCQLFANIAELAFARRYATAQYVLWFGSNENKSSGYHRTILSKYGGKISKMCVFDLPETHEWLLNFIEQKCSNVVEIDMANIPKIVNLKGLKRVNLFNIPNLNNEQIGAFIENNLQLEKLFIQNEYAADLIASLRLPMLKELTIYDFVNPNDDLFIPKLELTRLEYVNLVLGNEIHYERVLRAIDSSVLRELHLQVCTETSDNLVTQIGKFKTLAILRMIRSTLTIDQFRELATNLKNLTNFHIKFKENEEDTPTATEAKIFSILSMFPSLKKLKIDLKNYGRLIRAIGTNHSLMDAFYSRFVKRFPNTKLTMECMFGGLSVSKDRIYAHDGKLLKLHWMNNLDQKEIQKVMKEISYNIYELEFINQCTDNLDVATFASRKNDLYNLEITSKGPISINKNITRGHDPNRIFLNLRQIKIRLENHTAIDFLRNLHPDFCNQIEELCLETKTVDEYEKDAHESEMTQILEKFKNLKLIQRSEI